MYSVLSELAEKNPITAEMNWVLELKQILQISEHSYLWDLQNPAAIRTACPGCNRGCHESYSSLDRVGRTENGSFKKYCGKTTIQITSPADAISLSPTANTSKNSVLSAIIRQLEIMEKPLESGVERVEKSLKSELSDIDVYYLNI
ncbi:hypothetical protein QAD02_014405 [Eretmocerus hayati]|uniref:Uncharacterized protein n=1 Tax=Eretmocerus hayati TaxID=131215 RepID=A0ACC2P689_9HYME|nr:hypothetical protein QAD02_014405 [Eretmocerus hayati]